MVLQVDFTARHTACVNGLNFQVDYNPAHFGGQSGVFLFHRSDFPTHAPVDSPHQFIPGAFRTRGQETFPLLPSFVVHPPEKERLTTKYTKHTKQRRNFLFSWRSWHSWFTLLKKKDQPRNTRSTRSREEIFFFRGVHGVRGSPS
jgi:hypothetical protein